MTNQNQSLEPTDSGLGGWAATHWLKGVFEANPALDSLSEKHSNGGAFNFNFIISVKTPDGLRHRFVEWMNFNFNSVSHYVEALVADYPTVDSRWLDCVSSHTKFRVVVTRQSLGLGESDGSLAAAQKQKVLEENRAWMEQAFQLFPALNRIVKSANTTRSPTTFALCLGGSHPHHTWMKAPTIERVRIRMKNPFTALRASPPREIWVPGAGPAEGIEFTREDFSMTDETSYTLEELEMLGRFKLRMLALKLGVYPQLEFGRMSVEAIANFLYEKMHGTQQAEVTDEQKHQAIVAGMRSEPHVVSGEPRDKKDDNCTSCGASFATNEQFGTGDERLCGECELKYDEAKGERVVQLELVFVNRRRRLTPPPRKPSKFDPIPGVHDVGLGGSGPNWED